MLRTSTRGLWLALCLGAATPALAQSPDLDAPAPEAFSGEVGPIEAAPTLEPLPPDGAQARPTPWTATFPPSAIATYFEGAGLRVAVVGAGTMDADREDAEAALIAALRLSGAAELVMDDGALGDVSALSDAALVKAAARLPVERIIVIRIFPTGADAQPMAVVTIYNKAGAVLTAFTTPRGAPVLPRSDGGIAQGVGGEGVSARMLPSPDPSPDPSSEAPPKKDPLTPRQVPRSPEEMYAAQKLAVIDLSEERGDEPSAAQLQIVRGPHSQPVPMNAFVSMVDDQDLTDRYRARQSLRVLGVLAGLGLATASLPVFLSVRDTPAADPVVLRRAVGGTALLCIGLPLTWITVQVGPSPMEPPELRERVDTYNKDLKASLGLSALPRLRPRVALGPGGGFLGLEGQF